MNRLMIQFAENWLIYNE